MTRYLSTQYRPVEVDDVAFILSLRTDPVLSRYISPVEDSLEKQKQWLVSYKEKEAAREEQYFIIEDRSGDPWGTVRLYDYREDSFCWGSWILRPGRPRYAALESMLFIYDRGFSEERFKKARVDVKIENQSVVDMQLRFGMEIVYSNETTHFMELTRQKHAVLRQKYARFYRD